MNHNMSYAVDLVPALRVGTSRSADPERTRSVRAAFPRGAWERDRRVKKFNCVTPIIKKNSCVLIRETHFIRLVVFIRG